MIETIIAPVLIRCPYCGESNALSLEVGATPQRLYEDCGACCQPMLIELSALNERAEYELEVHSDQD